jgi:hypothetical protein
VPKPILYVVLALLILSGNALSQEVENGPEAADSAYIAAETDSAAAADSAVAAAPEPDSSAAVAAQEPDNIPVIESAAVLEQPIPLPIQPKRNTFWIAVGADIAGAGILGFGLYEEMNVRDLINRGKFPAAESKETVRNVCYVIGTLVLAAGISIHIFF